MNLKQHLDLLDQKQLLTIAKNNRIPFVEQQEPARIYILEKMNDYLLNFQKSYWIYEKISPISKKALYQIIYDGITIYPGQLMEIQKYGVCYNGVVPDDLRSMLRISFRNNVIRRIPDYQHKVLISYFSKAVHLLRIVLLNQSIKLNFSKKKQVEKFLNSNNFSCEVRLFKNMIDYFLKSDLVSYENNKLIPNPREIIEWFNSYPNNFIDLYQWILDNVVPEVMSLVKTLAILQKDSSEWVDIEVLPATISTNLSIAKCEKTGLLEFAEISNYHFVQLTNEGWFFAKKDIPPTWLEKNLLVSAAFEIFIPYNYDRLVFNYFSLYGSLKSNDFYSVFDLDLPRNGYQIKKEISTLLEQKARYIPEIVRYELSH